MRKYGKYVKVTDRAPRVGDLVRIVKPTIIPKINGVYDYMVGDILKIIDIEDKDNHSIVCEDNFSYRYADGKADNDCERVLDREEFEIVEEVNKFTKSDLEPCMVVEFRNGNLYIVSKSKEGLCFIDNYENFIRFMSYDENLLHESKRDISRQRDVMKVYGLTCSAYKSNDISTKNRELLFERQVESQPSTRDIKIKELQDQMDSIKRELDGLKDEN